MGAPSIAIAAGTATTRSDAHEPGRLGMQLVVATEASFFAFLLFSYFYLGSVARGPWPPSGPPSLRLALPNTFILLISSVTMWTAEKGIRAGNQRRLVLGIAATLILGAVFLAIQVIEYSDQTFTPATNAYGSLFYTITGFHGAHVFAGLLMNAVTLTHAARRRYTPARHLTVSNVAMYWHFVDAVWLAVFASLYIAPRLY